MTEPKFSIVRVDWLDSCLTNGWRGQDRIDIVQPAHCTTVGFLVRETDDCLVVASTLSYPNPADPTDEMEYAAATIIPRVSAAKSEVLTDQRETEQKEKIPWLIGLPMFDTEILEEIYKWLSAEYIRAPDIKLTESSNLIRTELDRRTGKPS